MEHVVFSAAQDGAGEEFRRVASLEEAVRVVEHLRNDLGILDPSVFALTPVPLAFRTYYRVEVPGAEEALVEAPVEAPEAEVEAVQSSLDLPPAELPDAEVEFEASEAAADDNDYVFDGHSDMDVSGLLPDASAIPASRTDELDRSMGYFAR
jgi:hypothetical protein